MARFRFLHSSDLHLGKRFGSFPEEVRGRLVEARHDALLRLAGTAANEGLGDILLAGDTFDTEMPSDRVRVQALHAMAGAEGVSWWILPGNHDSLRAEPLWDALRADAPPTVHVMDSEAPRDLAPGVSLLPAPLRHRFLGADLTAHMPRIVTPEGHLRIGLAHGPTSTFHEDGDAEAMIAPDRAKTAGLSYLALGDWHGRLEINDRTNYSGTPEFDRFRHDGRGACLLVSVEGGALPEVRRIDTGRFEWRSVRLALTPGLDAAAEARRHLPPADTRRDMLVRLRASGTLSLPARSAVEAAIERAAPEFGHFETDLSALITEATADDLDAIAPSGALRATADALLDATRDSTRPEPDRRTAARALDRLWSLLLAQP
ncbi:MAG: metallophosphoesterase [Pseudomonadota bacterium]